MTYDEPRLQPNSMLMIFRLLYRLVLQSLDRGATSEPDEFAATGGPENGISQHRPHRRRAVALAFVLGAGALTAIVLAVLVSKPERTTGGSAAALRLIIPVVSAAPLVVYLRGDEFDLLHPGVESSTVHRIRSVNGQFSPAFQIVPPTSTIEMVNTDSIAHNTHVFNRGETVFNVALPVQGVTVTKVLTGDGIFDVRCDMHPWMRAWLFVSPSRHYAVVHEPTTIGFTGMAPGEYILHVWQPDRPESIHSVNLRAGETRQLRLR